MILKSVRDLSELTLGEAEELNEEGAVLELTPEGTILVYVEKPKLFLVKSQSKGGWSDERNASHDR